MIFQSRALTNSMPKKIALNGIPETQVLGTQSVTSPWDLPEGIGS